METQKRLKILVAKIGLDGHDRGAKVIARALRDAGMEVIYSGLHQTADMIASSAVQEDVDAIGVSVLSGAHMAIFPKLLDELKQRQAEDVVVFGGGIIPDEDQLSLAQMGVKKLFTPGASTEEIISWIKANVS